MDQFATVYFGYPVDLDFVAVEEAAVSAAFPVSSMTLTSNFTLATGKCDDCEHPHTYAHLVGTDQSFRLMNEVPVKEGVHPIRASVQSWRDPDPTLKLLD